LLHHSRLPRNLDDIAHCELALDQVEEARDDVLDQALGAEGDGESQDAGAGQQRPDIDEDVEGEQRPQNKQGDSPHTPQELGDCVPALLSFGKRGIIAVVYRHFDPPGDQADGADAQIAEQPDEGQLEESTNHLRRVHLEDVGDRADPIGDSKPEGEQHSASRMTAGPAGAGT
jgi:hypothetical protein